MSYLRKLALFAAAAASAVAGPAVVDVLGRMPVHFEPQGASFVARMPGYGLEVTAAGARVQMRDAALELKITRGQGSTVRGLDPQMARSHYFLGADRNAWRRNVGHFGKVRVEQVYPGVDLDFYGNAKELEYDFLLAPGADPRQIGLTVGGAQPKLEPAGDILLSAGNQQIRLRAPIAYQVIAGTRHAVASRFVVDGDHIGFAMGAYDQQHPLVIDPVISFASYLGGNATDVITGIAIDNAQFIYVTGYTNSPNFPAAGTTFKGSYAGGNEEVFIAKFTSLGNQLLFTAFLGGQANERPVGIHVDGQGVITVAGNTSSVNFPHAEDGTSDTGLGMFVSKVSNDGSQLLNSVLFASDPLQALGIATAMTVDASGSVFLTGYTSHPQFPVTGPTYQGTLQGETDAFLAKLNPALTPEFATFIGGLANDQAHGIALDGRKILLVGQTNSANFPRGVGAYVTPVRGATDIFVARMQEDGKQLDNSAILGGSGDDYGRAVTVGPNGDIFLSGFTLSSNLPVTAGVFQPLRSAQSPNAGFLTKLAPNFESLVYSTYLGATGTYFNVEGITAVRVDTLDNAVVVGYGLGNGLPVTPGAIQSPGPGLSDGFILKLNNTGEFLTYGTYIGGSNNDRILAVTMDAAGNLFLGGSTSSTNFPVTPGAKQTVFGTDVDGFAMKVDMGGTTANCVYTLSASNLSIGGTGGTGSIDLTTGSGCSWTVTSSQPWLVFTSATSGSGNATITFSADANPATTNRASVLTVGGKTANITQTGAACTLTVDPGNRSVPAASGVFNFSVTGLAGCSWTATSNSAWLRLIGSTSGSGAGLVPVQFEENATGIPRTGWLTVARQGVHVVQPAALPQQIFQDVPLSHPFADHIFLLKNGNAADNCNGNVTTYCPEATTIRATMAQFIVRALYNGDNFTYPSTAYFTDVPPQHPQFTYIQKLRELGYTNGCGNNQFCPDQPVTRGQMAAFIIRTRERKRFDQAVTFVPTPFFTDVPAADIFYGYVQRMKELGITSGCSLTEYCPLGETTRGQMAVFVVRGLLTP